MAKKPTEKQLYKLKNEWLGQFFEEVKPKEFYRAVFPEGSFERKGHLGCYICITDVQKSIDKISGQGERE